MEEISLKRPSAVHILSELLIVCYTCIQSTKRIWNINLSVIFPAPPAGFRSISAPVAKPPSEKPKQPTMRCPECDLLAT